jgi:hypothetical protein
MLRAVIALGLIGLMCLLFAFQAMADHKVADAVESGIAGLLLIGIAYAVSQRTVLRGSTPHRRRSWARLSERPDDKP